MPADTPTSPSTPDPDLQDALFDLPDEAEALEDPETDSPGTASTETDSTGTDSPGTDPGDRLHLDYRIASDVGRIRKNNQDSGFASPTMLLVADGMGGAAAGDLASTVAVTTAAEGDPADPEHPVTGEAMLGELSDIVRRANNRLADLVADDHSLEGMGTTVSGGLFDGHRFGVCHIGDSRIYLIRDGEIEPLTHDHSWVQSLIDEGNLTEEEAAVHPHRSLLLKVLNGHPTNVPDTSIVELRRGDRLVLCSDGLCGFVEDEVILTRALSESLDEGCDALVEAALHAGGLDNITVILAEVTDLAPDPPHEPTRVGAVTTVEIPELAPRSVDLGDDEPDSEPDPDAPVRPEAPEPMDDDEEDLRYAIGPAPRMRWLRPLLIVLLGLVLLAGGATAVVAWGSTQYYVGVADNKVAIYQGLPQNVLGLPLSRVIEVADDVPLDDLPAYRRKQVEDRIVSQSLDDARATVNELRGFAEDCRESRAGPEEEC